MTKIILETSRLKAVDFELRHAEAQLALSLDEANRASLHYRDYDLGVILTNIERYKKESLEKPRLAFRLAVEEKTSGEFVGFCHLNNIPEMTPRPVIGYVIASHRTGRGYATELVGGLAKLAFARFAVPAIGAICSADNEASIIVLKRNGFVVEDVQLDAVWDSRTLVEKTSLRLDRPK